MTSEPTQDACYQHLQSCLANQIKDLHTADTVAAAAGKTPQYLITRYGAGNNGGKQARGSQLGSRMAAAHHLPLVS